MTIDWGEVSEHKLIMFIPKKHVGGADLFAKAIDFESPNNAISNAPGCGKKSSEETHKVVSSLIPKATTSLFSVIADVRRKEKPEKVWRKLKKEAPVFAKLIETLKDQQGKSVTELIQGIMACKFYVLTNHQKSILVETNSRGAADRIGEQWKFQDCLNDSGFVRYSPGEVAVKVDVTINSNKKNALDNSGKINKGKL